MFVVLQIKQLLLMELINSVVSLYSMVNRNIFFALFMLKLLCSYGKIVEHML